MLNKRQRRIGRQCEVIVAVGFDGKKNTNARDAWSASAAF